MSKPRVSTVMAIATLIVVPMSAYAQQVREPVVPPSRVIVIENQAEQYFVQADVAFEAIKKVGEEDDIWREAQQACQRAAQNPDDDKIQREMRFAKAKFLSDRLLRMRAALGEKEKTLAAHEAFQRRVEAEIHAAQTAAEQSQTESDENHNYYGLFVDKLQAIRDSMPTDFEFSAEQSDLLIECETQLNKVVDDLRLASDREQLDKHGLETWIRLQARGLKDIAELQKAYLRLPNDLDTFATMASNELKHIQVLKRQAWLSELEERPPIKFSHSSIVSEWLGRRRYYPSDNDTSNNYTEHLNARAKDFLNHLPERLSEGVEAIKPEQFVEESSVSLTGFERKETIE